MRENWSKITVISVAIVFYGFALLCWFKPADDISEVERRELAKMPELSMDSFAEGSFMDEFEEYIRKAYFGESEMPKENAEVIIPRSCSSQRF